MKRSFLTLFSIGLLLSTALKAQNEEAASRLALDHLKANYAQFGVTAADVAAPWVSSAYSSKKSGVTHVYFSQMHQGIEVLQATGNANIDRTGKLINMNVRFVRNLAGKVSQTAPVLSPEAAVKAVAARLEMELPGALSVLEQEGGPMQKIKFAKGNYALEPIPVRLAYYQDEAAGVRLVWEVKYYETNASHHWNACVDAVNGKILFMRDLVLHCDFGHGELSSASGHVHEKPRGFSKHLSPGPQDLTLNGSGYNVYPVPVESPNHGDRIIVTDPADLIASPFGWHDLDGADGADTTITMGNNVHAYQDANDLDGASADEPDGGPDLLFDFPYDPESPADSYRPAAVTNLFYWCNVMHDIWYQYGFDEPAGNFQNLNYGNGGLEEDWIRAEAQDGSGTNNANFSSGADGSGARIQMYLWTLGQVPDTLLTIISPDTIVGGYGGYEAAFGPGLPTDVPIVGEIVRAQGITGNPFQVCDTISNAAEISGKIAMIDRGGCVSPIKVKFAQDAGAIAVIVCNNNANAPSVMTGEDSTIVIPSIMISQADCNVIKAQLPVGPVTGSLLGGTPVYPRDGDFDSGIICHEYGHGVSIRLTGGPNAGNCLFNDEQMGEGWSDYIGMMLTMEEGDTGGDIRGLATFAISEPTDGDGLRPAPYSTDFAINPYTYAATNDEANISQPHGIGFVWSTMIWDMTWLLIDQYGFDPDFYNGTGGNNIAMQLVTEGMKLQPCGPGFIDGRDAILLADQQLYGGANQCLIWQAFAKRGLGKSASQGDSDSRTDQVEAFDLPNICLTPDFPPSAAFNVALANNCSGFFAFEDQSTDIPQYYLWDFGDGNTSTEENPEHTYDAEGTYEVVLIVTNTLGADTTTQSVTVDYIDAPVVEDFLACEGSPATLTAIDNGYVVNWYENGAKVGSGLEFVTPPLGGPTTIFAQSEEQKPLQQVGPLDNNIGPGGYHSSTFTGTVIFDAHVPFILESAWVDADGEGERLIELFDAEGNQQLSSVTVFIPDGQSVVTLNMEISQPGTYQVGGTDIHLYRNTNGAEYPYELEGILTMTGSPSPTGDFYYYYLYDWKVRELSCFSEQVEIPVAPLPSPTAQFSVLQGGAQLTFVDESTGAISWSWDFGDGSTATSQNPAHLYTEEGEFTITLTVSNGDCESTYIQTVQISNVSTIEVAGLTEFTLSPSLGAGQFSLLVGLDHAADLKLEVVNTLGQVVHRILKPQSSGLREEIDLGREAPGVYFVQLEVEGAKAVRRYVLVK